MRSDMSGHVRKRLDVFGSYRRRPRKLGAAETAVTTADSAAATADSVSAVATAEIANWLSKSLEFS